MSKIRIAIPHPQKKSQEPISMNLSMTLDSIEEPKKLSPAEMKEALPLHKVVINGQTVYLGYSTKEAEDSYTRSSAHKFFKSWLVQAPGSRGFIKRK